MSNRTMNNRIIKLEHTQLFDQAISVLIKYIEEQAKTQLNDCTFSDNVFNISHRQPLYNELNKRIKEELSKKYRDEWGIGIYI